MMSAANDDEITLMVPRLAYAPTIPAPALMAPADSFPEPAACSIELELALAAAKTLADALTRVLARRLHDFTGDDDDVDEASLYLLGRADEIAAFVADVVQQWAFEHLSDAQAAGAIYDYLDMVREGLRGRVRLNEGHA